MKKTPNSKKKGILIALIIVIVLISSISFIFLKKESISKNKKKDESNKYEIINDTISPTGVMQAISFDINRIHKKGIEENMKKIGMSWRKKPNYHYVVLLNDKEWIGDEITEWDTDYVSWIIYDHVKDEQEECNIEMKIIETEKRLLRTINHEKDKFQITYDFKTGRWEGDDSFNDSDGYGHFNGNNYEIWFDVHQFDRDGDIIPYWWEVNILKTNPEIDDSKLDPDEDGIPTTWEWKWDYDPFVYDNHSEIDPEKDGLSNLEEYFMRKWLADPYHQEIYVEVDFMEKRPGLFGYDHILFKESKYMVIDKFSEHDITLHIDDGWPGGPTNGGGEFLRYIEDYIQPFGDFGSEFYKYNFPDERKGIFRYMFVAHSAGWAYGQDYKYWVDTFSIFASKRSFFKFFFPPAISARQQRNAMASTFMHELGHTLGLVNDIHEGIDNTTQAGWIDLPYFQKMRAIREARNYWDNYQSCMNYGKLRYYVLGYSDGSNGAKDFDDWGYIDLTYFQKIEYPP
jgi:hypothetical protein